MKTGSGSIQKPVLRTIATSVVASPSSLLSGKTLSSAKRRRGLRASFVL